MLVEEGEYLAHYGILRKSGRYPWGSGETPHQRSESFLDITKKLRSEGMTESQIAKSFSTKEHPFTVNDLRALRSRTNTIITQEKIRTAQRLKDKGMSPSAIGRQMGINESSVRSLLEPGRLEKLDKVQKTAEMLKRQVKEKGFVDVGGNVEKDLPIGGPDVPKIGISPDKFKTALSLIKEEGYNVHTVNMKLSSTGDMIKYKVLCAPGVTSKEAWINRDKIRTISEKSDDGGHTYSDKGFQPPLHIDLKRVGVKYKEDGGADADGVIYVRPGVKDVELGKSKYAQVRIAVGGTHYLKGMAVYKDDLPAGVDLQFNTNKSNTGNKLDAMKPLKRDKETGEVDRDLPFGSLIKDGGQILGKNGKPSSVMNILNEEGDWDTWSRTLSPQLLSKQSPDLAKAQLSLTYDRRRREFEEIKSLTNPLIKKKLLETFGDETDSAAVHLKAAAMPNQANKVILPSNRVKPTEIFAPTYRDGERVALIRFPHAGLFEIPELTVNNKSREVRKLLGMKDGGRAPDVVVIHPKVAEHLSGADFDGDHVVVIPNNRGSIKSKPMLDQLKGFDPQTYAVPKGPKSNEHPDGEPIIDSRRKGLEMGNVTNLISDMTIRGASSEHLSRAVRHSMVVIDAEKHNLDYKASERDHGIAELKREYQGVNPKGGLKGASTLITRATAQIHLEKRKAALVRDENKQPIPGRRRMGRSTVDTKTGTKIYDPTGEINKRTGKPATFRSQKLAETHDAFTLVSEGGGTNIEKIYADHSNKLKALGNESRKEWLAVKETPYSKSSKAVYKDEVESLNAKLNDAEKNSPLERQAHVVAGRIMAQKRQANPDMTKEEVRKNTALALAEARLRTGSKKPLVDITTREWEAIQSGAISNNKLGRILNNTDLEKLRERATPRVNPVMTATITAQAKRMLASGATLSEVAERLGIAVSTLKSGVE